MNIIPKIILPFVLVALAILGYKKLEDSKPEKKSRPIKEIVTQAEITEISPAEHTPTVESFGTVQPHFQTTLTPQISGLIIKISPDFRVGNIIPKGTTLIWIDERSYRSLLIQQEANLAAAKLAYAEEKIQAEQAREDWIASGRDLTKASDFVLRKPQIISALANIESMKASVRRATGDLARTMIKAPFDAIVTSRTASLGNLANEQQPIGALVATERVEVHLPFTPAQMARLNLSEPTDVTLTSPTKPGHQWQGRITRVQPTIGQSQTVTAIVEVEAPFTAVHLSVGLFVNAHLTAIPLPPCLKIPEAALVNDSFLWALDAEDKLIKIVAQRLTSENGSLFVSLTEPPLDPPFRIISRPLANFQLGQKVVPVRP